jgi:uracil-DNA glycosylase
MPGLQLVLLIGQYAQAWHLGDEFRDGLTETVRRWREILLNPQKPRILPLPHPSWRNNGWLRKNPWFEAELLPVLQHEIREILKS